ncbi:hypothetical protein M9Y10_016537 [Tritrichomonas musculus]|uniref:Uncharacterized protein n=1 Tax=Tritrichomonas musculus TaxID=1915356 RepID=A0ABR2HX94_9EUKA
MNNQSKDGATPENEPSEKNSNTDSSSFENNIPTHFIQQLYELTKKTIEMTDENTQTSNFSETDENTLKQGSSPDLVSITQDQDICYQTVVDIFLFFKRRFSIPFILNTIHQCAGDIPIALQKLNHSIPKGEEPCNFSYHKISGTKDQIDAYFTY